MLFSERCYRLQTEYQGNTFKNENLSFTIDHNVFGVEVDHFLEAEGVNVDPLIVTLVVALVVCRG